MWNRTSGRDSSVVERGAESAATVTDAVTRRPLIVACLLRHCLGPRNPRPCSRHATSPSASPPGPPRSSAP
ncbi:hypothetical protein [Amycolatopsis pigmentata]|uniref:Uncharacterized protein n=1 Tax=Amycolatopsis pigmentata TaxID=450801 RepID=A0ABW5FQD4_9PSEU